MLAVVFGVIMYRVILLSILFVTQDEIISKFAKIITSMTAAFINLVAIVTLNRVSSYTISSVIPIASVICILHMFYKYSML